MSKPYLIAADELVDETIVSRSRFICYLFPCQSLEQAKQQLKSIQSLHPQASHHCHAFVAGKADDSQKYGFSDDGEPSGTAGKPMLIALQGSNIGQVCAIVVRYFGGTKLGTGGLQRAYGGSVRQALTKLKTITKVPMVNKTLVCQYTQINDVLYVIEQAEGEIIEQNYAEQVNLVIALPISNQDIVEQQLKTLSCGQIKLNKCQK
ncbi:YigZ family protein [Thalassotalea sp. PLHSN55]|uniref:YigZ family protein n=1 Tax=Thalassotalea sp. PLHSN55 TaxID=3435888 RepID=UPI003F85EFA4